MNSIRDDMKDEIRQALKGHFDPFDQDLGAESVYIDDDLVTSLADAVFDVMDIDPADQDRPKEQPFKFYDAASYEELIPGSLVERGIDFARRLGADLNPEYLVGISVAEEVISIFNQDKEFIGMIKF